MRLLHVLVVAGVLLPGCTPQCEKVCRKATECGLTARLNQLECEESCIRQKDLYEDWEDEEKIEAFAEHRRCSWRCRCRCRCWLTCRRRGGDGGGRAEGAGSSGGAWAGF